MAKLTVLLALAFTALVAFATAHTTIVTTTVEDDNIIPVPSFIPPIPGVTGPMCRIKLQFQQLDKCQTYLQQGLQQGPYELNRGQSQHGRIQGQQIQQQCCQQLQNVESRCQCEAVKKVFEDVQQQVQGQQQQGQLAGRLQQQLEQKAQNLPQQCRLQIREQECQIRRGGSSGSQQCSRVQGQRFNQCQRFIQQAQQQSGSPRVMMYTQQPQQLQQQLRQCCNELEEVQRDCQCEALEEVYRQAIQEQQQGGQQQQPWQQGQQGRQQQQPWQQGGQQQQQQPWQQGGQQQQPWQQGQQGRQQRQRPSQQGSQQIIGRAIDTIRNQCNLEVQQCRIPSAMF